MRNDLSVILPTLNERDTIIPLIVAIEKSIHPKKIIVVDDNSSDGTMQVIQKHREKHANILLLENTIPLGLTQSLERGIHAARSTYVAWMDADFSHPPSLLPEMYTHIKYSDVVVGSWIVRGGEDMRREVIHKFMSNCINYLSQLCFGRKVHAYTSGYVMTKRNVFEQMKLRGTYGEYCIDFLVRSIRSKKIIVEVPFVCISRIKGESKTTAHIFGYIKKGCGYLKIVFQLLIHR